MCHLSQVTCFVLESQKVEKTPAKVTVEAPLLWRTMDDSGLQGLSAGGSTAESQANMESIPELPTTWTGSKRPCRRTECTVIHYNDVKMLMMM